MRIKVDKPRETALKILYDINEKGAYSNISLNKYLNGFEFESVDRAFITDIVYGTLKWKYTIDYLIEKFSSIKIKKLSPWILNILRMGIYQIIYMDRIPVSAACNESVKLATKYGHAASSKYVNAVLRNIARSKENLPYPDKNKDTAHYLSIKYSHPLWMVKDWLLRFGEEFTEGLLKANNDVARFTVRVNDLKISKEELIDMLTGDGFEVENGKYLDEALIIKNPSAVQKMGAFAKGYFQVQDESSMLVAKVLDPKPGETVLDVCSAPGGKSTHIAQIMKNRGTVISRDIHEHKIKLIEQAKERLGLEIIKIEVFDAAVLDSNLVGKIDRVLVDAPCTGFGIIRRKPDIKWSRNLEDKAEIVSLQEKILSTASEYVKDGGVLVYSTCTIEPEENEKAVEKFVSGNKDFYLEDITDLLPESLRKESASKGYIQLYPNIDGIDGFFIARMRKRSR
ncbi:MAG TPA: 16S rRNA (cytosine(967)-C(5))-methyltransferase RsmB [Acetivibrio sp.]|uniref:16S rRNA (cytosine(967)-C(5))-methyltransferase RsmB n=1 Tax=Acetivibrio sp. TaxID=1872092 RepID=UPI002B91D8DB|nr:16S rRNA (cytosine(967)-C(5))-methyltransferase RsmB [Acetivibrio sp.]HOM01701.1 16S rRNA (cytosine(967)-C(5))-methyltransferase RsmB [Acetivibrio sp.]